MIYLSHTENAQECRANRRQYAVGSRQEKVKLLKAKRAEDSRQEKVKSSKLKAESEKGREETEGSMR